MRWQRRKPYLLLGSILIIGCLVVTTILNTHAINRQLHAWKVLPEPEHLTELYFTDHTKLPTTYFTGAPQTVTFTVHNLEYRTTTYHYRITQADAAGAADQQLASGSFTLAQNAYQRPSVPITLGNLGNRSKISVTLSDDDETIAYWVTKEGV